MRSMAIIAAGNAGYRTGTGTTVRQATQNKGNDQKRPQMNEQDLFGLSRLKDNEHVLARLAVLISARSFLLP